MQPNSVISYRIKLQELKNGWGGITPPTLPKKPTQPVYVGLCKKTENGWEINLPIRTVSESNTFEHWKKTAKRHKDQKNLVSLALAGKKIPLPCTIIFKRYAPKLLDAHDNLRTSFKYLLDQTCAEITQNFIPGQADNNPGFTFEYDQEKSKDYSVKITIKTN